MEKNKYKLKPLALAFPSLLLGTGLGLSCNAFAASQATTSAGQSKLEEVLVQGQRRDYSGTDHSAISKLSESLLDTPQSISALSNDLLNDRGLTSLNAALSTVPGITLGAGEFRWQGNAPSIRGFSARDDMYMDGMRDFGSYSRDPFNLEAVEVLLGPSSLLFGRGSTGGAINQVSKLPRLDAINQANLNLGTDNTKRATLDIGGPLTAVDNAAAWRLNLLDHQGDVAGRDGGDIDRWGIAPSLAFGLGSATELTLSYLKQVNRDQPDYGLPWLRGEPAPVDRTAYYGFTDDHLDTDTDVANIQLHHTQSEILQLNAQLRYADYKRNSQITEPLITQSITTATALEDIAVYRNVFLGHSREKTLSGQFNAVWNTQTGFIRHTLVSGVEFSREHSAPVFAWSVGSPQTSLLTPDTSQPYSATSGDPLLQADAHANTSAVFALDTLKWAENWQLSLGLRRDRFDIDYKAEHFAGPATPFSNGTSSGSEAHGQVDTVTSYRAGLVYKFTPDVSFYLADSTSFNPSGQEVSFITSGRTLATSNVDLDPEKNRGIEAGIKTDWQDGRVSFNMALFKITKTNARVADPSNPGFNMLAGEQKAKGVSLDLHGTLTDRFYLTAGYVWLDSANLAPGASNSVPLEEAPENSFSLWADYALSAQLDFGFGARYVSSAFGDNRGTGKQVPGYHVFDAMARYQFNEHLTVKLNLSNFTDTYYFEQLHRYHVVPGPGKAATLAFNLTF